MRTLAALALAGALVVNAMANALPLGGRTTGELSALYPNLFVSAGITFSIWGVIYLLAAAWGVAQFRPAQREPARRIAPAFTLSSVLNAAWLFAWHFEQVLLSVLVMAALLGALLRIHRGLEGGAAGVLPRAAFGMYLGWIEVALLANVSAWLVAVEWGGWGIPDPIRASILVLAGAAAGLATMWRFGNPWVGLAMVWALLGIAMARWPEHPGVAGIAVSAAVLVMAALTLPAVRSGWSRAPGVAG